MRLIFKKFMSNLLLLMFSVALFSCTVAPIRTSTTARSLGEGKHQLGTSVIPALGLVYEYGIKNDLDLGVGIERQLGLVFQVFGKYSFYQKQDEGFSHAVLIGASKGVSFANSNAYFVGLMSSYRHKWIEPFVGMRYNYVRWKFSGLSTDDKDDLVDIPSTSDSFSYWQADIALNFLGEKFKTTIGYLYWFFPDGSVGLPALSFAYAF